MVTANVRSSAQNVNSVLQERNVQGLAIVAFSAAGGVVVAQEIADRVLPAIIDTRNPTDFSGFAASAIVKAIVAVGFGILATNLGGLGLVAAAYMAVGALAGAGADLLHAVQRSGLAAESPAYASAYSQSAPTARTRSTPSSTAPSTNGSSSVSV